MSEYLSKRRSDDARSVSTWRHLPSDCPTTSLIVEGWIADDPTGDQADTRKVSGADNENGRGVPRNGQRVRQMGGRSLYRRSTAALLQLAQIWLDTASQLDGLPATRIAPIRKWPGYLFLRYRRGRDCVRRGKTGGIIGGGNLGGAC